MALTTIPLPFGMRDIRLTPFTTPAATAYGTPVDLPNARTLAFTENEEATELRGDDRVVASHGSGPAVEWELESGGISFEAFKILSGATITESGTTPNQIKSMTKLVTQDRPYFKIEGQAISDSGGDFHMVIWKAKATGELGGSLGDQEFFLTSASGIGVGSTVAVDLDKAWTMVQNETVTAIP